MEDTETAAKQITRNAAVIFRDIFRLRYFRNKAVSSSLFSIIFHSQPGFNAKNAQGVSSALRFPPVGGDDHIISFRRTIPGRGP